MNQIFKHETQYCKTKLQETSGKISSIVDQTRIWRQDAKTQTTTIKSIFKKALSNSKVSVQHKKQLSKEKVQDGEKF